jgi:hypothetical protein
MYIKKNAIINSNSLYAMASLLLTATTIGYFLFRPKDSYLWGLTTINTHSFNLIEFNNIPSFVFVFSFSIISLLILKTTQLNAILIIYFWLIWSLFWEFIQLSNDIQLPYLSLINNYANGGFFDIYDVIATLLGSITASAVYFLSIKRISRNTNG